MCGILGFLTLRLCNSELHPERKFGGAVLRRTQPHFTGLNLTEGLHHLHPHDIQLQPIQYRPENRCEGNGGLFRHEPGFPDASQFFG